MACMRVITSAMVCGAGQLTSSWSGWSGMDGLAVDMRGLRRRQAAVYATACCVRSSGNSAAQFGDDADSVLRAEGDFGLHFEPLSGNQPQAPALGQRGQHQDA